MKPIDEAVGQALGHYKLLEKLGEGGWGVRVCRRRSSAHAKVCRVAGCPGSHRLMAANLVVQIDRRQIRLDT